MPPNEVPPLPELKAGDFQPPARRATHQRSDLQLLPPADRWPGLRLRAVRRHRSGAHHGPRAAGGFQRRGDRDHATSTASSTAARSWPRCWRAASRCVTARRPSGCVTRWPGPRPPEDACSLAAAQGLVRGLGRQPEGPVAGADPDRCVSPLPEARGTVTTAKKKSWLCSRRAFLGGLGAVGFSHLLPTAAGAGPAARASASLRSTCPRACGRAPIGPPRAPARWVRSSVPWTPFARRSPHSTGSIWPPPSTTVLASTSTTGRLTCSAAPRCSMAAPAVGRPSIRRSPRWSGPTARSSRSSSACRSSTRTAPVDPSGRAARRAAAGHGGPLAGLCPDLRRWHGAAGPPGQPGQPGQPRPGSTCARARSTTRWVRSPACRPSLAASDRHARGVVPAARLRDIEKRLQGLGGGGGVDPGGGPGGGSRLLASGCWRADRSQGQGELPEDRAAADGPDGHCLFSAASPTSPACSTATRSTSAPTPGWASTGAGTTCPTAATGPTSRRSTAGTPSSSPTSWASCRRCRKARGTMLDNTVVLWVSEFGNSSSHSLRNLMWFVMGNVGGFFKQGQVLKLPGRSVSDLHLTLAKAFGIHGCRRSATPPSVRARSPGLHRLRLARASAGRDQHQEAGLHHQLIRRGHFVGRQHVGRGGRHLRGEGGGAQPSADESRATQAFARRSASSPGGRGTSARARRTSHATSMPVAVKTSVQALGQGMGGRDLGAAPAAACRRHGPVAASARR